MEKDTKVVYLHRKATDGTIFYVGMGNSDRVNNTTSRNKWWKHTYNKHGLKTEIVASDLSIECAYELEVFLISELGRKDKGLGNLVNMDDGGKGASYLKIINTETNEVFYSIEAASVSRGKANCKANESQYNVLSQKLKESSDTIRKKVNNTDFMYYSDYENGRHLTKEWINRKIRKPSVTNKPNKNINIYDFKEQVWITTTSRKFEELYNIKPVIRNSFLNGRFCREEYSKFDEKNNQWKNVINIKTKEVERFNQRYLANKLGVKSNNLSAFFRGIQKKAYGTYMIVQ